MAASTLKNRASYDEDYHAWCLDQAERARRGLELDLPNIAEEIESLGKSDRRALDSHFTNLLVHLLKWQLQSDLRGRSWLSTIHRCRNDIEVIVKDSPSLASRLTAELPNLFRRARKEVAVETGLDVAAFPETCPWTVDVVLNEEFLPEA